MIIAFLIETTNVFVMYSSYIQFFHSNYSMRLICKSRHEVISYEKIKKNVKFILGLVFEKIKFEYYVYFYVVSAKLEFLEWRIMNIVFIISVFQNPQIIDFYLWDYVKRKILNNRNIESREQLMLYKLSYKLLMTQLMKKRKFTLPIVHASVIRRIELYIRQWEK